MCPECPRGVWEQGRWGCRCPAFAGLPTAACQVRGKVQALCLRAGVASWPGLGQVTDHRWISTAGRGRGWAWRRGSAAGSASRHARGHMSLSHPTLPPEGRASGTGKTRVHPWVQPPCPRSPAWRGLGLPGDRAREVLHGCIRAGIWIWAGGISGTIPSSPGH